MEKGQENYIGNVAFKDAMMAECDPLKLQLGLAPDNTKYEILQHNRRKVGSRLVLYRIRALKDIVSQGVRAGDLGGWIEETSNLSQEGTCWVHDNAMVYGKARVLDYAAVRGRAVVCDRSTIKDRAEIKDDACLANVCAKDCTVVSGRARVSNAVLTNYIDISGRVRIDKAELHGDVTVTNHAKMLGVGAKGRIRIFGGELRHCDLSGDCMIGGGAILKFVTLDGVINVAGSAKIISSDLRGRIQVVDDAVIAKCRELHGDHLVIGRGAKVSNGTYLTIGPLGQNKVDLIAYRIKNGINYSADDKVFLNSTSVVEYLTKKSGIPRKTLKKLVDSLSSALM